MNETIFIVIFAGVLSFLGYKVNLKNLENDTPKIGAFHKVELPKNKAPEDWTSADFLKSDLGVDDVRKLKYKKQGRTRGNNDSYLFANPETNKTQVQFVDESAKIIRSIFNPLNKNYEDPWPEEDNYNNRERKKFNKKNRKELLNNKNLQKNRDSSGSIKDNIVKKLQVDYSDWEDVE
jgi:hypothetical protein